MSPKAALWSQVRQGVSQSLRRSPLSLVRSRVQGFTFPLLGTRQGVVEVEVDVPAVPLAVRGDGGLGAHPIEGPEQDEHRVRFAQPPGREVAVQEGISDHGSYSFRSV